MSLIKTDTGRIVLKNADSVIVVPYVYNAGLNDYILDNDFYDISSVIGDSIAIEQSEGNTEVKENEFKSAPLIESTTGVEYAFTMQCLDLQNNVLRSLFGAMTSGDVVAFKDGYKLQYVLVRIHFDDASTPDVILPKVRLNSSLFIQQLRTRAAQGNIGGKALPCDFAVKNSQNSGHLLQFTGINEKATYVPHTPVVFVPDDESPMFARVNGGTVFRLPDFSSGSFSNIYVDPSTGTWSTTPS